MDRPLTGVAIGISISEAEDFSSFGLTANDVTLVTVELAHRFVALGAQIVLGHQWRPRGVMEAVVRFAHAYQTEGPAPVVHNFLAWPNRAALSETDRKDLRGLVAIYEQDRKPEYEDEIERRIIALREMRQRMTQVNHARICLAGKLKAPSRFSSGLVEEAALTLAQSKPIYVSRMMGGTAALLIDVLQRRRGPTEFPNSGSKQQEKYLYQIADIGESKLADWCGLACAELQELFEAQNLDTIVQLTSRGLVRRRKEGFA